MTGSSPEPTHSSRAAADGQKGIPAASSKNLPGKFVVVTKSDLRVRALTTS
jgi:hypothetical protein